MAQFTSYNQVGLKEDVSDIITDITPTDTPRTPPFAPRRLTPYRRVDGTPKRRAMSTKNNVADYHLDSDHEKGV